MLNRTRCLICGTDGNKIYSISYNKNNIRYFFLNYYGNSIKVKKFLQKIKKYNYDLYKCINCKFIWQANYLRDKLQNQLYDSIISPNLSLKKSQKTEKKFRKSFQLNFNFLKQNFKRKKIQILDFGAGWGSWISSLKESEKNIFALESSKERVRHLKKNKVQIINYKDLIKKNYKFDFIRLEQVLEHIGDLNKTLKILKKISKTNTLIYVSVPNSDILFKNKWRDNLLIKGPAQPLEHLNSFTKKSLTKIFLKFSFKKVSMLFFIKCFFYNKKLDFNNLKILLKLIINNLINTSIILRKI